MFCEDDRDELQKKIWRRISHVFCLGHIVENEDLKEHICLHDLEECGPEWIHLLM